MTPRRLTAVALAAATAAATLGAGTAQAAQHDQHDQRTAVRIGAVQYDSPGRDDRSNRSLNAEWVTLVNHSRRAVDLQGWTLTDDSHHSYRFHHLWLGAYKSVKVHTGQGHNSARNVYQDRRSYVWNNDHDGATLRDARGHVVDHKSWGHHHR